MYSSKANLVLLVSLYVPKLLEENRSFLYNWLIKFRSNKIFRSLIRSKSDWVKSFDRIISRLSYINRLICLPINRSIDSFEWLSDLRVRSYEEVQGFLYWFCRNFQSSAQQIYTCVYSLALSHTFRY